MYGRAEAVTGDLVAEAGVGSGLFLATKVWTSGREAGIAQMRRSAELLRSPRDRRAAWADLRLLRRTLDADAAAE